MREFCLIEALNQGLDGCLVPVIQVALYRALGFVPYQQIEAVVVCASTSESEYRP